MSKKDHADKLRKLLERAGINITRLVILGSYVHIDTFKKYDQILRETFTQLGADVRHLPGDARGVHLDGSTAHRLVARFA